MMVRLSRWLTIMSVFLFVVHFFGFWVLATTWATGLVWWMNVLTLLGPPVALTALVVTLRKRAQPVLATLNGLFVLAYTVFWAWLIPHLSWRG